MRACALLEISFDYTRIYAGVDEHYVAGLRAIVEEVHEAHRIQNERMSKQG